MLDSKIHNKSCTSEQETYHPFDLKLNYPFDFFHKSHFLIVQSRSTSRSTKVQKYKRKKYKNTKVQKYKSTKQENKSTNINTNTNIDLQLLESTI